MESRHCFIFHSVRWCVLTLLLCVGNSALALAEDDLDSTELPIVLTASRMRQPLGEAPAAVTVIDREMIEQSGVRQIADLLRFVPGAVVGYNDGNWPVVTLRGLSSVYASGLQVLIDGVSVYSPIFGGMLWSELPISIDDIERIEVVRGPNAASYGANSFQGVVNIITRSPATEQGVGFQVNAGGFGIRDETLRVAASLGNWHYRATIGQRFDEGFASRLDSQRLNYLNFKSEYQINAQDSIDFSLRLANKNKQSTTGPTTQEHPLTGNQLDFQTRWNHAKSADNEWWVQFYHQQFAQRDRLNTDLAPLFSLPFPLPYEIEQDYATWRDGIEFQSSSRWSDQMRSVWGAEIRRDTVRSGRYFGTNDEQSTFLTRLFGNVEWHFARQWTLNSGTMFERNSLADNAWSPRIALIYEVTPGHTLRASVSSARRTPSLEESRGNYSFTIPLPVPPFSVVVPFIAATGNVDSEKVNSQEVGYVFNISGTSLIGDVRWFSDHYTDLIANRGQVKFLVGGDFFNLDQARTTGLDMTLQWNPLVDTHVRLAAAHTRTTSTDIGGMYSTSVPNDTLSLLLSRTFFDGWTLSANYQRVGAMFWVDAGQNKQSIPAIDHLNLRLAKSINMGDHAIEIAGVLQNALGHYRDYYLGSSQGTPDNIANRVFFVQMKVDY